MSLFYLPTDCLVEILSKWLHISDIPKLNSAITNKCIRIVILRILRLNHCILSGRPFNEHSVMYHQWLMSHGLHVEDLTISLINGLSFGDATEIMLSQQQTVRILNVKINNDPSFAALCIDCRSLTSLHIIDVSHYSNSTVTSIIQALPCEHILRELSLSALARIPISTLVFVAKTFKNLAKLSLMSTFICVEPLDTVTFPNLVELKYTSYADYGVCGWIVRGAPLLKNFDCIFDISINSELRDGLEKSRNLEVLTLSESMNVDSPFLSRVVALNKRLACLSIGSDNNIDCILDALIAHCPNFHALCASKGSASESVLIKFVTAFPNLDALTIGSDSLLTSSFVNALVASCDSITNISLPDELMLTDDDITKICRTCHELKKIDVSNSILLTDRAILNITAMCDKLETLHIWIGNMTAGGLHCLSIGGPSLHTCRFYGFDKAQHGRKIQHLKLMKPTCTYDENTSLE